MIRHSVRIEERIAVVLLPAPVGEDRGRGRIPDMPLLPGALVLDQNVPDLMRRDPLDIARHETLVQAEGPDQHVRVPVEPSHAVRTAGMPATSARARLDHQSQPGRNGVARTPHPSEEATAQHLIAPSVERRRVQDSGPATRRGLHRPVPPRRSRNPNQILFGVFADPHDMNRVGVGLGTEGRSQNIAPGKNEESDENENGPAVLHGETPFPEVPVFGLWASRRRAFQSPQASNAIMTKSADGPGWGSTPSSCANHRPLNQLTNREEDHGPAPPLSPPFPCRLPQDEEHPGHQQKADHHRPPFPQGPPIVPADRAGSRIP